MQAIALEIDEMKDEVLSLANQQDANGSFIFGGYKTKNQPFQKNIEGKIEYKGDAGRTSLSVSETMAVQTSVDGESLFQKIKGTTGVTVSMFTMLENISHSVRTASSAVHATKADTHAEFEITNRDAFVNQWQPN